MVRAAHRPAGPLHPTLLPSLPSPALVQPDARVQHPRFLSLSHPGALPAIWLPPATRAVYRDMARRQVLSGYQKVQVMDMGNIYREYGCPDNQSFHQMDIKHVVRDCGDHRLPNGPGHEAVPFRMGLL